MKEKVYYEVDSYNRLVIKSPPGKSNVKKFRRVVSGRFKTDKKNKLYYEVFKSSGSDVPQKIGFSGKYSLNEDHSLTYTLDKWGNQCQGNALRLKTAILHADGREVAFFLNSKPSSDKLSCYTVRLRGGWSADKNNRLCFEAERNRGSLTFSNAWQMNKHNEIVYRFGRQPEAVSLKGNWQIRDKYRLAYVLDKRLDSGFDFKTSFGQIVPRRRKSYARFDVSIVLSKKKRITRSIVFTGNLKLDNTRDIILEYSPHKKTSLKFTKDIFDRKGLAYLESFIKDKEGYVGGGLALRW